jgi:7-keto-8-aminopelargonate synthetase-like enzyme
MFDSESFFRKRLDELRAEGRYRLFADLIRRAGAFPRAYHHSIQSDVTVWCSNDYLGMGQHPAVLATIHEALDSAGTRNISGTSHYHVMLEREIVTSMTRKRHCFLHLATLQTKPRCLRWAARFQAASYFRTRTIMPR